MTIREDRIVHIAKMCANVIFRNLAAVGVPHPAALCIAKDVGDSIASNLVRELAEEATIEVIPEEK